MLTKLAVRQGASNPWPRVQFGPANPRHVAKEERDVNFYFEPEASCSNILFVELIVFGIIWFVIFSSTTVTVLIFNRNFLQKSLWLFCIQTSNTDMTIQLNVWGGGAAVVAPSSFGVNTPAVQPLCQKVAVAQQWTFNSLFPFTNWEEPIPANIR